MARLARVLIFALAATLFFALAPGTAVACSCAPVTTAEMVESAHTVFVGEEVARSESPSFDDWASVAVTFRVVEAYKGALGEEITVLTGHGGGDCGVGRTVGLVGITVQGTGEPSINSCGSVHDPSAIAALLDPIELIAPPNQPPPTAPGWPKLLAAAGAGVVLILGGVAYRRYRRQDWQDGWTGGS